MVRHLGDFYAQQSDDSQVKETPRGEEAATQSDGTIPDSDSSFRQDNVTGDAAGTPQSWVKSPSSQGRPPSSRPHPMPAPSHGRSAAIMSNPGHISSPTARVCQRNEHASVSRARQSVMKQPLHRDTGNKAIRQRSESPVQPSSATYERSVRNALTFLMALVALTERITERYLEWATYWFPYLLANKE